jgi:hypothetical protein
MGFRIFAAGTDDFHYENPNFVDKSDFDMVQTIAKLQGLDGTAMGVVATGVDFVQPSAGITDLMDTIATTEFLHNLSNAACFLAMCSGAAEGWISVSARETHYLWPDTAGFARYRFSPGESPGSEFLTRVGPVLRNTGMANWGVLLALGNVLGSYSNRIGLSGTPMINIQLTK